MTTTATATQIRRQQRAAIFHLLDMLTDLANQVTGTRQALLDLRDWLDAQASDEIIRVNDAEKPLELGIIAERTVAALYTLQNTAAAADLRDDLAALQDVARRMRPAVVA